MPVPVFAAVAPGACGPARELRAARTLRFVASPRHARVLLVAGAVPAGHLEALRRVHDQLPHPRATVWWAGSGSGVDAVLPRACHVAGDHLAVVAAIRLASERAVADDRWSDPDVLPDVDPNPWRGVGPHGQGGEGMMGGVPYGRPMAMTAEARDGLTLDRLDLTLGPFLTALPPGLSVRVALQGDVVEEAELDVSWRRDARQPPCGGAVPDPDPGDARALRLRDGLRWLVHALDVAGLDALAIRAAGLVAAASAGNATAREIHALVRAVRASGVLAAGRDVGGIEPGVPPPGAEGLVGTVRSRWQRRLEALVEVSRPGGDAPGLLGGFDPGDDLDWLAPTLVGGTLSDLLATLVSLDLRFPPERAPGVAG